MGKDHLVFFQVKKAVSKSSFSIVSHKEPGISDRLQNFRFLNSYFLNELCSLKEIKHSVWRMEQSGKAF
jgi:hypothetical protein